MLWFRKDKHHQSERCNRLQHDLLLSKVNTRNIELLIYTTIKSINLLRNYVAVLPQIVK